MHVGVGREVDVVSGGRGEGGVVLLDVLHVAVRQLCGPWVMVVGVN